MKKQIIQAVLLIILLYIVGLLIAVMPNNATKLLVINTALLILSIILFFTPNKPEFKTYLSSIKPEDKMHIYLKNRIKNGFKSYFDTTNTNDIFEDVPDFRQLGLTDLDFVFTGEDIKVIVTLFHPGVLIGVGGKTLDSFEKYLSNLTMRNVKIDIKEPTFLNKQKT